MSLFGTETLDKGALVSITNRAQAICLCAASDTLLPKESRDLYKQANELLIKAMKIAIG